MALKYHGKHGELRLYSGPIDGTTDPDPATAISFPFLTVAFVNMDFTGMEGRPRPEETAQLDRGNLTTTAHYTPGSDEAIMAPLQISFTAHLDDTIAASALRAALSNPERIAPWEVNTVSFANQNGMTQLANGNGSLISTPTPFDSLIERVTLQVLWDGETPGTTDEGRRFNEVYFPADQQTLTESEASVQLAAAGMCYGPISAITVFQVGSSVN